jgi:hypothetical protein
MKRSEELLKSRGGATGKNYSCPVYLSTSACKKLFDEAGVDAEDKCIGMMGDVLENFAMMILRHHQSGRLTPDAFRSIVAGFVD